MKIKIVGIGLCLVFGCCGQRSNESKDVAYLRIALPTIETPIIFNSNHQVTIKRPDALANAIIDRLRERYFFNPWGKIFETSDYLAIIGFIPTDTGTPIIIVIDSNGNEVDSHPIYETVMGDIGQYTSNFVTILPDRQIHFVDSTLTRKITADGLDEIAGTDSLSVTTKKYRLTNKGVFERVE